MDNKQQLIDYINQELQSRKSPDEIKTALISNGWAKEDVEMALSNSGQNSSAPNTNIPQQETPGQEVAAIQSPTEMTKAPFLRILDNLKSKKKLVIVLVAVAVIFFIIIALVLVSNSKAKPSPSKPTPTVNAAISVTGTPMPTVKENVTSTLDCKDNMSCFIQASIGCKEAKILNELTLDMFGVEQTTVSQFEIRGSKGDKCQFYLRTESIEVVFPTEIPQEVVNEQKVIFDSLEGKEGICLFNSKDLTEVLLRWDKGDFDSGNISCKLSPSGNECTTEGGDFSKGVCTGTYFEQLSQEG